jgi:3(or 17)beta-hydroxysteroid dehydrogenase
MGRVDGKVVIVSGGATGLGESHVRTLVGEGARVVFTDLKEEEGRAVAADLGDAAHFVAHNVTDEDGWRSVLRETLGRFGGLDGLVNNAGVVVAGTIEELSLDEWRRIQSVNVDGTFLGCKIAVEGMKTNGRKRGGSIINISSASGLYAKATLAAYNTSKAAVTMLTKSVALHTGQYGIRCNSVHPGTILTPMVRSFIDQSPDPEGGLEGMRLEHPIGTVGEPVDVSNIVLYLASDESKFATGGEYRIDGGLAL